MTNYSAKEVSFLDCDLAVQRLPFESTDVVIMHFKVNQIETCGDGAKAFTSCLKALAPSAHALIWPLRLNLIEQNKARHLFLHILVH